MFEKNNVFLMISMDDQDVSVTKLTKHNSKIKPGILEKI